MQKINLSYAEIQTDFDERVSVEWKKFNCI